MVYFCTTFSLITELLKLEATCGGRLCPGRYWRHCKRRTHNFSEQPVPAPHLLCSTEMLPAIHMEHPFLHYLFIASCHHTRHSWRAWLHPLHSLFRYLYTLMVFPLDLLYSSLNRPSSLSFSSQDRCSNQFNDWLGPSSDNVKTLPCYLEAITSAYISERWKKKKSRGLLYFHIHHGLGFKKETHLQQQSSCTSRGRIWAVQLS